MEDIFKKYRKGKTFLGTALILIALNIIILLIIYQIKIRFSVEDHRFKYLSSTDNMILFQDGDDNKVTVTMDGFKKTSAPFPMGIKYKIEYMDKVIECDDSEWMSKGQLITLSDGSQFVQGPFEIDIDDGNTKKSPLPFDVQLVNEITYVYNFTRDSGFFFMPLLTIPLMLLGLVSFIYPEKVWEFQHALLVSGGEPTDWATSSNKIGGALMVGFALLLPIFIANR